MILNDLDWLSKIFNNTKHRAVSVRQLRFLYILQTGADCEPYSGITRTIDGKKTDDGPFATVLPEVQHDGEITTVCLSTKVDERYIVCGSTDATLSVFDRQLNHRQSLLVGHDHQVLRRTCCSVHVIDLAPLTLEEKSTFHNVIKSNGYRGNIRNPAMETVAYMYILALTLAASSAACSIGGWCLDVCPCGCRQTFCQIATPPTVFLWFSRNLAYMISVPICKKKSLE